jgi:uncharacterized membrane protein YphA (DoxX/SURF4 family)
VEAKKELKGEEIFMDKVQTGQWKEVARTNWLEILESNRFAILIFRLILAGCFLTSAYGKLVDIERYSVDAVYNFGILPMFLARPFGLVMPFVEFLCGLGLLFGILTRLSALGIALMSISFFIAKAIVLSQGRSIECGCFGAVIDTLASVTIFMDLPMVALALLILFAPPQSRHWTSMGKLLPESWKRKLEWVW